MLKGSEPDRRIWKNIASPLDVLLTQKETTGHYKWCIALILIFMALRMNLKPPL